MYNDPNAQPPYGQGQSPYTSPYEQQYTQYPPQPVYPQTPYGAPPPVYVPPPQQKSSSKTIWIVLGVIGAIILLVGGGCCALFYFVINKGAQSVQNFSTEFDATATAIQQTVVADEPAPSQQAQDYYLAISVQDYSNAFSFFAPNMTLSDGTKLTVTTFTQKASQLDVSEGKVTDYTATADSSDPTKVTVQVTRSSGKSYTVHLTFTQGSDEWVINSFDDI